MQNKFIVSFNNNSFCLINVFTFAIIILNWALIIFFLLINNIKFILTVKVLKLLLQTKSKMKIG